MQKGDIRVVVPCYDSDLTIEKCISSILDSRGIDFELIIVDDGGNNKIGTLRNQYPFEVIKTKGHEGAGKARNSGTQGFNGPLVIFIDSDVQINPDTLAALIKPIKENLAEATVGSYSKIHCNNFYQAYKHLYLAYRYGTKPGYLTYTFWSAVCAVDYKTFTAVKGFKESFMGAGPEDIDLGIELSGTGARILSVPEAVGIHLAELDFTGLIKNDLQKGTEDIYIHWSRKVTLNHNRHVTGADILSVFIACSIPVLLILQHFIGIGLFLVFILLYFIARIKLIISAFGGENILFKIRSFLLTGLLDVIRGFAVVKGTLLFFMEILSSGKYKPFVKLSA